MIKLYGTLVIKEIKGANGKFCVGDLTTPEGDFKVKEPILDQFAEGRYEGEFSVERFYLSSYVWRGKSTTDIRAKLVDINLSEAVEGEQEATPSEPDPIMTDIQPAQVPGESAVPVPAAVVSEDAPQDPKYRELLELLGNELAELAWESKPIKLDPTVDRAMFRRQRDMLKTLGYSFDAKEQQWHLKSGD